jgi:hypothetical protein
MIEPLAGVGYASKAFIHATVGLIADAVDQALHARYGHIRSPL